MPFSSLGLSPVLVRAAAELGVFDKSGDEARRARAVQLLETAVSHWKLYSAAYTKQYEQPQLYNRVGWVNIPALIEKVQADVDIAKQWQVGSAKPERRRADIPFKK